MPSIAYREAYSEVLDILEHMRKEEVDKISPQFLNYLKENASKSYVPKLNHFQDIKDMKLKPKTRPILAVIYRMFLCNEEERKKFDQKLMKNQEKMERIKKERNTRRTSEDTNNSRTFLAFTQGGRSHVCKSAT